MKRYLASAIKKDLGSKLVLLSGPRQVGKTTLARSLSGSHQYLNFDSIEHRRIFHERSWDRKVDLLIFDELHKMPKWKQWLKGVYDTEGLKPKIIVTGSARFDTFRKVGDSLAGRYFPYRLHPVDLREYAAFQEGEKSSPGETLDTLLSCSGFPEPFLEGSSRFYRRWQRTHLDIILRQDLIETADVSSLVKIETLVELLRSRVGQLISHSSLARDLEVDDKTVKRWLSLLEMSFLIFKVTPFHRNVARALQKASKYYFFDPVRTIDEMGQRLENIVALSLLKEVQRREDLFGEKWSLHYVRTRNGHEVDFVVALDGVVRLLAEVKWQDEKLSKSLRYFKEQFPGAPAVQLVKELQREATFPNGCEVRKLASWLSEFELSEESGG